MTTEEMMEENRASLQVFQENDLICFKLLQWEPVVTEATAHRPWRTWRMPHGRETTLAPTFTVYVTAGLILDALAAKGEQPALFYVQGAGWECATDTIENCGTFPTAPAAIRACGVAWCLKEEKGWSSETNHTTDTER